MTHKPKAVKRKTNQKETLRDKIAIAALQGILSNPELTDYKHTNIPVSKVAWSVGAYEIADYMLKVRNAEIKGKRK